MRAKSCEHCSKVWSCNTRLNVDNRWLSLSHQNIMIVASAVRLTFSIFFFSLCVYTPIFHSSFSHSGYISNMDWIGIGWFKNYTFLVLPIVVLGIYQAILSALVGEKGTLSFDWFSSTLNMSFVNIGVNLQRPGESIAQDSVKRFDSNIP